MATNRRPTETAAARKKHHSASATASATAAACRLGSQTKVTIQIIRTPVVWIAEIAANGRIGADFARPEQRRKRRGWRFRSRMRARDQSAILSALGPMP